MSEILMIDNIPEVSFIDNASLDDVLSEMITDYQDKYLELTGQAITLGKADPNRLILNACAIQIYQGFQYIDRSGKQNLLKYSYDEFLDNLGALKGVIRNQAKAATVRVMFTLSEVRSSATAIPSGTRVNAGNVYFASTEYKEIPAGSLSIEIEMTCTEPGEIGNDFMTGEINTLTDPIPYIQSVSNTTISSGGSEIETNESMAERIYLAPSSYSTAGPDDAYIYWAKTYSQEIYDVNVSSANPCEVDIRFILQDGEIPDANMISGLQEFLMDKKIRPLTDLVTVGAPAIVSYNIQLTYYINKSSAIYATTIQAAVNEAIQNYINWQNSKIGRDINPSELTRLIMAAGAKRVVITAPTYIAINETSVASLSIQTITYGGIEDD